MKHEISIGKYAPHTYIGTVPNYNQTVIAHCKDGMKHRSWYDGEWFRKIGGGFLFNVIAWEEV